MALLTTKGVFGVLAILEIAKGSKIVPVSIKDIADKTGISRNYLQQILDPLRNEGIIGSIKGKNGGYFLQKDPSEITFYKIFNSLEKDVKISNIDIKNQPLSQYFSKFDIEIEKILSKTLKDFYEFDTENAKYLNFVI
ncbi:MAG: Rrf2 family transcriptional regulator [Campylobacter sp.]|nr:Rrf2 family transcriptional regulator [Campylobacter sp.]